MKNLNQTIFLIVFLFYYQTDSLAFTQMDNLNSIGSPVFFTLTEKIPSNAQVIFETSFINDKSCNIYNVLQELRLKASEHNANAIKIIDYRNHNCLEIKAYLLKIVDIQKYNHKEVKIVDYNEYAVVHIYNLQQNGSSNLHLNLDTRVKIQPRSKATLLLEPGIYEIGIDKISSFTYHYKAGKTYFLRVDLDEDLDYITRDRKLLELIGMIEFESQNHFESKVYKYHPIHSSKKERLKQLPDLEIELEEKLKPQVGAYTSTIDESEESNYYFNLYVGLQTSPFRFKEGHISHFPTNPDLIDVDYELEPKRIVGGPRLGLQVGNKIGFLAAEMGALYSSRVSGRGNDEINMYSIHAGKKIHSSETNTFAFSLGFGHHTIKRNLPSINKLDVSLRNRRYFLNPAVRYEYRIPGILVGFFAEINYVHLVFNTSTRSGLIYEIDLDEPRDSDGAEIDRQIIRFNNPDLNYDQNSRLNYGNRFNFSIGFFIGLNSKR
ncbi:MAG: hypothetical protein LAT51_01535 [Flavobacteriaceae bacterium]|nr:hypothetical protein [Flavobacteriaceae bacterium]